MHTALLPAASIACELCMLAQMAIGTRRSRPRPAPCGPGIALHARTVPPTGRRTGAAPGSGSARFDTAWSFTSLTSRPLDAPVATPPVAEAALPYFPPRLALSLRKLSLRKRKQPRVQPRSPCSTRRSARFSARSSLLGGPTLLAAPAQTASRARLGAEGGVGEDVAAARDPERPQVQVQGPSVERQHRA